MSCVYLETSAVLTWLLGEPPAEQVRTSVDDAETVVTSVLTVIETERALLRAEGREIVSAAMSRKLRGLFHQARAGWLLMEMTREVQERAGRSFPQESVRSLDAIHLATALEFVQVFPEMLLLTYDQRVQNNAVALGLSIHGG